MTGARQVFEVFLQPGEWYFGAHDTRIRTVLGSCVSLALWHRQLRIGGMCHYMLPSRGDALAGAALDGRYGDEALALLVRAMHEAGTRPEQYDLKMFGGGSMFAPLPGQIHVPQRNIEAAHQLAGRHGLRIAALHLGGVGHRHVAFDLWSGDAWVRHHAGARAGAPALTDCPMASETCASK